MKLFTAALQTIALISVLMIASPQTSPTAMRTTPIGVGDVAPDFTLEDQSHNKVALSGARNKRPVVLVFYRGYW